MKRLLLACLLLAATNLHAQLFKQLLDRAKTELANAASKHANRLLDEGLSAADSRASKVSIISSKKKEEVAEQPKSGPSPTGHPRPVAYRAEPSSLIAPAEVDKYLSETFPKFYAAYRDAIDNDPLIKEVSFGYREGHKVVCSASPKNGGTIFFDMYYFENRQSPEDEGKSVFEMLLMQGLVNSYSKVQAGDKVLLWGHAFGSALSRTYKMASGEGYCLPLNSTLSAVKKRAEQENAPNKDMSEACRKLMAGSMLYKMAASWMERNGAKCTGEAPAKKPVFDRAAHAVGSPIARAYGLAKKGYGFYGRGSIDSCIEYTSKAVALNDTLLWAKTNLGLCYLIKNEQEKATGYYMAAMSDADRITDKARVRTNFEFAVKELDKVLAKGELNGGKEMRSLLQGKLSQLNQ